MSYIGNGQRTSIKKESQMENGLEHRFYQNSIPGLLKMNRKNNYSLPRALTLFKKKKKKRTTTKLN